MRMVLFCLHALSGIILTVMINRYYVYLFLRSTWIDVNVAKSTFKLQNLNLEQRDGKGLTNAELGRLGFVDRPRSFQLISPSRYIYGGCCAAGISVLSSPDSKKPLYEVGQRNVDQHIISSIWGEPANVTSRTNFCASLLDKVKQWMQMDDKLDYAMCLDKISQPPLGDCAVSCETSVSALMARLDVEGEFDPERMFILQSAIPNMHAHPCTFGRYEGKMWKYGSEHWAVSEEMANAIFYNYSKENSWDSDQIMSFELEDAGEISSSVKVTTHFCHMAPDGTVSSIGS